MTARRSGCAPCPGEAGSPRGKCSILTCAFLRPVLCSWASARPPKARKTKEKRRIGTTWEPQAGGLGHCLIQEGPRHACYGLHVIRKRQNGNKRRERPHPGERWHVFHDHAEDAGFFIFTTKRLSRGLSRQLLHDMYMDHDRSGCRQDRKVPGPWSLTMFRFGVSGDLLGTAPDEFRLGDFLKRMWTARAHTAHTLCILKSAVPQGQCVSSNVLLQILWSIQVDFSWTPPWSQRQPRRRPLTKG